MDIDLAKLAFKVKVPEGCTLVTALRLPSGQLIDLDDLVEQEARQVSSVDRFKEHTEAVQAQRIRQEGSLPKAPSDGAAIKNAAKEFVREEAERIDPDNIIRLDRFNRQTPLQVRFGDARLFLREFIRRKQGGAETCVFDDPKMRTLGYIDYTANEHCCISLPEMFRSRGQLHLLLPSELADLGVDDLDSLKTLLGSEGGRAHIFGSDAYGFDQPGEMSMEKALESLWETTPEVDHV